MLGVAFVLLCVNDAVRKGLLPPAILFAYNAYLCFGALTNDPDTKCNPMASGQGDASIYAGLAIAALSVTWMAFSSAGQIEGAVRLAPAASVAPRATVNVAARTAADWPTPSGAGKNIGAGAGAPAASAASLAGGAAASYQRGAPDEEKALAPPVHVSDAAPVGDETAALGGGGGNAEAEAEALRASRPWVFDLVMCLAGMYLAMLVTNWGDPGASNSPAGNPELSQASMWARIGTQFAIHAIFLWTIVAPMMFPNRDFSSGHRRTTETI